MKVARVFTATLIAGFSALAALEAGAFAGWIPSGSPLEDAMYRFIAGPALPLLVLLAVGYVVASTNDELSAAFAIPILPGVAVAAGLAAIGFPLNLTETWAVPDLLFVVLIAMTYAVAAIAWRRPRLGVLATGVLLGIFACALVVIHPWLFEGPFE